LAAFSGEASNPDYFAASRRQPASADLIAPADSATQIAELLHRRRRSGCGTPRPRTPPSCADAEPHRQVGADDADVRPVLDAAGRSGKNPMQDARVRRAIYHAIDRAADHQAAGRRRRGAARLDSMCPPVQFGCATDVHGLSLRPGQGEAAACRGGYADGSRPLYAYRDRPFSERAGYLRKVGLTAELRFLQWTALRADRPAGGQASWRS